MALTRTRFCLQTYPKQNLTNYTTIAKRNFERNHFVKRHQIIKIADDDRDTTSWPLARCTSVKAREKIYLRNSNASIHTHTHTQPDVIYVI